MIEIKLTPEKGRTGYDAVAEYIRRYWEHYRKIAPVLVSITTSFNGEAWDEWMPIQIAYPDGFRGEDISFIYDWWEGEKYIRLYGINFVDSFNVYGGIFEENEANR